MKIPGACASERGTAVGPCGGARWRKGLAVSTVLTGILLSGCSSAPTVAGAAGIPDRPVIINHEEILQARRHEYLTTGMMEQGVVDTTVVGMLVDTLGSVEEVRVGISSQDGTVDRAALRVARIHRFEPARNQGRAVAGWVILSISFEPRLCDFPPNPAGLWMVEELNAEDRRGETTVAILVDERGRVSEAKIGTSSGWDRFDQAALRAARKSRYHPGMVHCEPAEKWTTMKFGFGRERSGT